MAYVKRLAWHEVEITTRPLHKWPPDQTTQFRTRSPFKSVGSRTMQLLRTEVGALGADRAILEADFSEREVRTTDGMPRMDARPSTPRVVLNFKHPIAGDVRMPCDTFEHWLENVRAIALALRALRAVDRYGVTKRAEQYTGYRALPVSTTATMGVETAAAVLAKRSNVSASGILKVQEAARNAVRQAAAATHPDSPGGSTSDFQLVQEAKRVVFLHHAIT